MKKTLGLVASALVCAVMMAVAVSAGAESITFGPSAAHMGANIAIVSPTTTGTQEFYLGGTFDAHVAATGVIQGRQWYKGAVALTDDTRITGALTANLVITGLVAGDAGVYTCVVTGDCGLPATTPDITVAIIDHLVVTPPVDTYLCVGGILDKIITVSGGKLPYDIKWTYDIGLGGGPQPVVDGPSPGLGMITGAGNGTLNSGTIHLQVTNAGPLDALLPGYGGTVTDAPLVNTPDL